MLGEERRQVGSKITTCKESRLSLLLMVFLLDFCSALMAVAVGGPERVDPSSQQQETSPNEEKSKWIHRSVRLSVLPRAKDL